MTRTRGTPAGPPPLAPQQSPQETLFADDFEEPRPGRDRLKHEADKVVEQNKALWYENQQLSGLFDNRAGAMLLVNIALIIGRFTLYIFVEKWGHAASVEAAFSNLLFGGASVAVLFTWVKAAWASAPWLMIPNAVLVYVSLVICISQLVTGEQDLIFVMVLASIAMVIGASPLFIVLIQHAINFLRSPIAYWGGDE